MTFKKEVDKALKDSQQALINSVYGKFDEIFKKLSNKLKETTSDICQYFESLTKKLEEEHKIFDKEDTISTSLVFLKSDINKKNDSQKNEIDFQLLEEDINSLAVTIGNKLHEKENQKEDFLSYLGSQLSTLSVGFDTKFIDQSQACAHFHTNWLLPKTQRMLSI